MAKKTKRVSNNPNGRPKIDDKKVLIGVYLQKSLIDENGGKEAIRELFKNALKK